MMIFSCMFGANIGKKLDLGMLEVIMCLLMVIKRLDGLQGTEGGPGVGFGALTLPNPIIVEEAQITAVAVKKAGGLGRNMFSGRRFLPAGGPICEAVHRGKLPQGRRSS